MEHRQTLVQEPCFSMNPGWIGGLPELEERECTKCPNDDYDYGVSVDSFLCIPGSRLVPTGFTRLNSKVKDIIMFVNAGGESLSENGDNLNFKSDSFFQGGDVLRTNENITEGGDFPSIYQSARFGNFSYQFNNLPPGDYFIDLHFAEIINTFGPKGMRKFNVFMQEEKILSELDIFSIVGSNKPLQLVDVRVSLVKAGKLVISFEDVYGNPIVSAICIRKAPTLTDPSEKYETDVKRNCILGMEGSVSEMRPISVCGITKKYEWKIEELSNQCQIKTNECYEAWMSLASANDELQKLRMELDYKMFETTSLDQAIEKQTAKLNDLSNCYNHDKKLWATSINKLEEKVKVMKRKHSELSRESHECVSSIPQLHKMVSAVKSLVDQCQDLKEKYIKEQAKRRKLYNEVQETKGNIRVFCRCRPPRKDDISYGSATFVDLNAAKDGELVLLMGGSVKKIFKFDRVYTPKDDQAMVFADASPLVVSVLDGYNVCIFAYGQTGTGKTYTMEGPENNRGVNYRTLEKLFNIAKERSETFNYNISVSVLEVYNEQIRDLLATEPTSKRLEIRQSADGEHYVPGMVEANVENIKEVWKVLQVGSNSRAIGSNNVNEHSSRSHCILCVMVKAENLMNGECTKSKLWLVDLAGSERLAKTDAQGERLKEAQNINRSLSALGDVISALANKSTHIPYRNSKLTHLLQDSLGGESKALMFVQISPSENDMGETLSSLNFATRVRGIELGPAKKQIDSSEIQKMKITLDKSKQESRSKDESIRKLEENCENLESKLKCKDQLCKNQQDKIKVLEGQLESKTKSQNQSERQWCQLSDKLKGKEEMCTSLQQKVKELESKLKEQQQTLTMTHQEKVKELETKVKEHHLETVALQQKVKDLEIKLKESVLQLKCTVSTNPDDNLREMSNDRTQLSIGESTTEIDTRILKVSDSINRVMSRGSTLPRGRDSLIEIKKKRQSRGGSLGGSENNNFKKGYNRSGYIDSSKVSEKIVGTKQVGTSHKLLPNSRVGRDQGELKERDKTRIWSR